VSITTTDGAVWMLSGSTPTSIATHRFAPEGIVVDSTFVYWAELDANPDAVAELRRKASEGPVTFVYAARDEQHNGALALKEYLRHHLA